MQINIYQRTINFKNNNMIIKNGNHAQFIDFLCYIKEKYKDPFYIKVHFGRSKKINSHIDPGLFDEFIKNTNSVFIDTNTLYPGERSKPESHLSLAHKNGFIKSKILLDEEIAMLSGTIINVAHITGHSIMGLGACIKNIGMGLANSSQKLWVHGGGKQIQGSLLPKDKYVNQAYRLGQMAKKIESKFDSIINIGIADEVTLKCDCQGDTETRKVIWKGFSFFSNENAMLTDIDIWNKFGIYLSKHYRKEVVLAQFSGYKNGVTLNE